MSGKLYVTIVTLATLLSWAAWLLVLFLTIPGDGGNIGLILFYSSLFLSLLCTMALVGLLTRHVKARKKLIVEKVIVSFRQAFWLAALVVAALFLQSQQVLTWWNALLLVLIVTVLEFFFMSAATSREHRKYI